MPFDPEVRVSLGSEPGNVAFTGDHDVIYRLQYWLSYALRDGLSYRVVGQGPMYTLLVETSPSAEQTEHDQMARDYVCPDCERSLGLCICSEMVEIDGGEGGMIVLPRGE